MTADRLIPRYSVDDYRLWKGDWELWDGFAIAMSPSPFGRHQAISRALFLMLGNSLESQNCDARPLAELDWIVSESTVVRPDLLVVCDGIPEGHLQSVPGFVAEVLSESTRGNDLHFKRELYESQGVPTYLVLDPESREVTCHRLTDSGYQSTSHRDCVDVTVCGSCQIEIDVAKLFR